MPQPLIAGTVKILYIILNEGLLFSATSGWDAAMRFTVLSCSLDPRSRSRLLAQKAAQLLTERGHEPIFLDLRDLALPQFDNSSAYEHPDFLKVHREIEQADGIFIASPVYNWGLGSAVKNLIELTGATGENGRKAAWFDKVVTFLCASGLPQSYMAYGPLAFSLMLDFKCVINPYAVYATDRDFEDDGQLASRLTKRVEKTVLVKIEIADALRRRTYRSDWEV